MTFETENWNPSDDVTRALPHAVGPEKSVLSTCLQDPQEFIPLAIEEGLTARHFYLPAHATLFDFLLDLFGKAQEIELVSLVQRLIDAGKLDRVGGPSALYDIYGYQPTPIYFRHHIAELRTKYAGREIIRVCNHHIAEVYDSPDEIPATLEGLEREVMAIRDTDASDRPETIKEAASAVIADFEDQMQHKPESKGLMTGFDDLDRVTNGLHAGEMTVIGARPSVGKTAFMMNIVEHVSVTNGFPVLVFSAEMTTKAITRRLIMSRARFALSQLSRGYTPNIGDLQRIQRASMEVGRSPLHIDDTSGPSIGYIRAKSRRLFREHGIRLIAIDYLGLIKSVSKQSQFSREREISEISAGIKGLAKDLGIPIILLAQLNRKVEDRGTKNEAGKPRMSDLKDSGSIEADADVIGLLSREGYQGDDPTGAATLDLAKNRNGATGPMPLTFIADLTRFETGAPRQEPKEQSPKSRFDD